jgi:PKD repeat protein
MYATPGTYTVSVTVTDANAKTATASATIIVSPAVSNLTVTINCPTTGTVGTAVNCTATSTGGTGAITFSWTATGGTPASGTGASFSTTYNVKGSKTISVVATDSATPAATATASTTVTIAPQALSVTIAGPTTGTVGTAVSFTATATGGTSPYTFAWNFGDSTTGTGATASHTYATAGTFTVTVTVTDANAKNATSTQTIIISTVTGTTTQLTFDAFDIDDFSNGVGQLSVLVNGHLVVNIPTGQTGSGDYKPYDDIWVHFGPFDITSFIVPGENTIVFMNPLTSHDGLVRNINITQGSTTLLFERRAHEISPTRSFSLTFSNPPLAIISYTINPLPAVQGVTETFTATFAGGSAPFTCSFTFGDGATPVVVTTSSNTCSATHSYNDNGNFLARVKITGHASTDVIRVFLPVIVLENNGTNGPMLVAAATVPPVFFTKPGTISTDDQNQQDDSNQQEGQF